MHAQFALTFGCDKWRSTNRGYLLPENRLARGVIAISAQSAMRNRAETRYDKSAENETAVTMRFPNLVLTACAIVRIMSPADVQLLQ